jgi:hypothetical protein
VFNYLNSKLKCNKGYKGRVRMRILYSDQQAWFGIVPTSLPGHYNAGEDS